MQTEYKKPKVKKKQQPKARETSAVVKLFVTMPWRYKARVVWIPQRRKETLGGQCTVDA